MDFSNHPHLKNTAELQDDVENLIDVMTKNLQQQITVMEQKDGDHPIELDLTGKETSLTVFTSKEFDVLPFLAMNPNQVFSKDHLFQRIWGLDSSGDISAVTVHIRKIREKIERDASNPETV